MDLSWLLQGWGSELMSLCYVATTFLTESPL